MPQELLDKYHDDRAKRVRKHIEEQIAAFYAIRPDKEEPISEITVREGDDVAQLILDEAKAGPADLILMGSTPRAMRSSGLLFGSVVQEVTRKSDVPLLLVPIHE